MTTQEIWALLHTSVGTPGLLHYARSQLSCPVCIAHFDTYVQRVPPAYGSAWFPWTVGFHNEVNERLGKPLFSVVEAHRRWSPSPVPETGSAWSRWILHEGPLA